MIYKCTCDHIWQDKQYGTLMRVMNICKDPKFARCTVCGKKVQVVKNIPKVEEEKDDK